MLQGISCLHICSKAAHLRLHALPCPLWFSANCASSILPLSHWKLELPWYVPLYLHPNQYDCSQRHRRRRQLHLNHCLRARYLRPRWRLSHYRLLHCRPHCCSLPLSHYWHDRRSGHQLRSWPASRSGKAQPAFSSDPYCSYLCLPRS